MVRVNPEPIEGYVTIAPNQSMYAVLDRSGTTTPMVMLQPRANHLVRARKDVAATFRATPWGDEPDFEGLAAKNRYMQYLNLIMPELPGAWGQRRYYGCTKCGVLVFDRAKHLGTHQQQMMSEIVTALFGGNSC